MTKQKDKRRRIHEARISQKKSKKGPRDVVASDLNSDSPVIVQKIHYNQQKQVPTISLQPDLNTLLYPMKDSDFLKNNLRQRAVHVTCAEGQESQHAEARIATIRQEMFGLNAEAILRETSSDNIFLWLRKKDFNSEEKDLIQSIEIADPDTAIALHKTSGHATYCRAPADVEQNLVSSLLRATGLGCGQYDPSGESIVSMARGEVETFISTPGHVTNWHYDFQENFTIQLSGTKRWTLQQGTVQDPIRGCTPHYAAPEAVESQLKAAHLFNRKFRFGYPEAGVNAKGMIASIDLKPGDVFYFPAGMWHKVETVEPGISINVSLMASNYATIFGQAIQHYLLRDPRWRQPILHNATNNAVKHLDRLIQDIPAALKDLSQGQYIIPPILQYPPRFQDVTVQNEELSEGNNEWEDVTESGSENLEEPGRILQKSVSGAIKSSDDVGNATSNDSDEEEINDNREHENCFEEEELTDPNEFDQYPKDWTFSIETDSENTFTRNPLAILHHMDEVSGFYRNKTKRVRIHPNLFLLNINYAGNDMHQSSVRVIFSDAGSDFITRIYENFESRGLMSCKMEVTHSDLAVVKFLVYHGYMFLGDS